MLRFKRYIRNIVQGTRSTRQYFYRNGRRHFRLATNQYTKLRVVNIINVIRQSTHVLRRRTNFVNNVRGNTTLLLNNPIRVTITNVTRVTHQRGRYGITLRPFVRVTVRNRLMFYAIGNNLRPNSRNTEGQDYNATRHRTDANMRASRVIIFATTYHTLGTRYSLVHQTLRRFRRLLYLQIITRGRGVLTLINLRREGRVQRLTHLRSRGSRVVVVVQNGDIRNFSPFHYNLTLRPITGSRALLISRFLPLSTYGRHSGILFILRRRVNRLTTRGTHAMGRGPRPSAPPLYILEFTCFFGGRGGPFFSWNTLLAPLAS